MVRPAGSLVLCYHAVTDAWEDRLAVRPSAFAAQISTFVRGRRGGTAEAALAHGRGVLHVTFDDALESVPSAISVLERYSVPATVFVCAAYGDGRPLSVPELSGERFSATALRTLTWDELRALAERGVEIGSHTMTHPHLTRLADEEVEHELREARSRIEDEVGRPCRYVAYPYGDVDDRVRAAARAAGYTAAFGLPGTMGDTFDHPRVGLFRRDSVGRAWLKSLRLARAAAARVRRRP
jgi:peptidoglycan/xylan/chitin deacetylase (PgdA/CDA1 family)